jgi:nucleotide-binding universal stress UspA family protein
MKPIERILVPVDFSDTSRAALSEAADLAERLGASIEVLSVWEPPVYIGAGAVMAMPGEPSRDIGAYTAERAGRDLDRFVAPPGEREGLEARTRYEIGFVGETILRIAREGGFDLIVMGTRGRRGLARTMMGSVAERVVRHASCPVLTVRARKGADGEARGAP